MEKIINEIESYIKEGMTPLIPFYTPDYIEASDEYEERCIKSGKVPILKDWAKLTDTTMKDVQKWIDEYKVFNIGLVLGNASRVVAVNIDGGEKGMMLLQELSKGELPETWEFTAPNGGYIYLYVIPEGYIGKKFRKHIETSKTQQHVECALLGDGEQIVLPPSKHQTGDIYKWKENHSPKDIEIAEAPKWMIEKMTECHEAQSDNKSNNGKVTNSPRASIKEKSNEKDIDQVKQELEKMIVNLIDDKYLYLKEENLKNLLFLNKKSPYEYKKTIEKIAKVSEVSRKEINREIKKFKSSRDKEKLNKINHSKKYLQQIGFLFNEDGSFKWINGNIFARHIKENFDLLIFNEETFYQYVQGVWKERNYLFLSKELRDFLHSYIPDIWTEKLERTYLESLKREVDYIKQMNPNREYINLKNGMYNLNTYQLEPHRKELFSSVQVPIEYNPEAKCPMFKEYLKDVFEGDEERIKLVQEMMGYCLTSDTRAQKGFILLGEGSNGKSVLCDIMVELYGIENISSVPMKELNNPFARYDLVNKTVNISTENEIDSNGLNTQYLKAIITGDLIRVEEKYKQGFEYRPYCKLVFAANRLPFSKDKSYGFTRRLEVIPFNRKYKKEITKKDENNNKIGKDDPSLSEKLKKELGGILNFAIEGLKRLRENDFQFTKSKESKKVLEAYKEEINVVLDFIRQYITESNITEKISRGKIRLEYEKWCEENKHKGSKDISSKRFWKEFRKALENEGIIYKEVRSNGRDYFKGIALKEEVKGEIEQYLASFNSKGNS